MTTTLDRDVAEAIYRLLGDTYETEWILDAIPCDVPVCNCSEFHSKKVRAEDVFPHPGFIPLPNFPELIRLLPKIGEKKGWEFEEFFGGVTIAKVRIVAYHLANCYLETRTEEEGMKQVSEYLRKIL